MLQINTGKLYEHGVGRTNQLTGVLYANVRLPYNRAIVTRAGTLRSTGSGPADLALVYELEERIEKTDRKVGVLVSHTVGPFLDDFAVVASFGLGGVFSREPETVRALTGGRPGFSSYEAPEKFVTGFFDRTTYISDEQADAFVVFVDALLALERRSYLGAMRAMRTFVAGLHSIPDDLALAYTLIVSSCESLAQDFDGFAPAWSDLDGRKRNAVDAALTDVIAVRADAVRSAILEHEHVALARRYRAFVQAHVNANYFREPNAGVHPVTRFELDGALRQAYEMRSAYIHRLRPLPTPIALPHGHWETITVERRPALTFQGLFRLTRHVIRTFVTERPKIEKETYNYTLEQAGVVSMEFAPQYWVWRPLTDPADARRRLEGMLSLTTSVLNREPDAKLVDLRPMLADIERLLPQAAAAHRPALLALHILFNLLVNPDQRTPGFDAFLNEHSAEASRPSIETVVVSTVLNAHKDWTREEHRTALELYFAERTRPKGLHAPRLLEAAACLALAEKYRIAGESSNSKLFVERAFEAHPAHVGLREFEASFDGINSIEWEAILLPKDRTSE
ncbi:MAG: hypothetical protein Q8Q73_14355 [Stagnimonas sp.]|nr:hypothetical protein [Stagnimonas sp.]